jgi:hypothetical protein
VFGTATAGTHLEVMIDMEEWRTMSKFSVFQAFKYGKVTHIEVFKHP